MANRTCREWAQGTAISARVGQAMYVYGNFGHNYVQLLYDLGVKKHNIVGFTWARPAAPLVIAGGAAWPFKDELLWQINAMLRALGITTGVEKFVWDKTRKYLGDGSEILGRRGLFGLAGIDISGSLGIGLGKLPTGLLGLTGALGGVAEDLVEGRTFYSHGADGKGAGKDTAHGSGKYFPRGTGSQNRSDHGKGPCPVGQRRKAIQTYEKRNSSEDYWFSEFTAIGSSGKKQRDVPGRTGLSKKEGRSLRGAASLGGGPEEDKRGADENIQKAGRIQQGLN